MDIAESEPNNGNAPARSKVGVMPISKVASSGVPEKAMPQIRPAVKTAESKVVNGVRKVAGDAADKVAGKATTGLQAAEKALSRSKVGRGVINTTKKIGNGVKKKWNGAKRIWKELDAEPGQLNNKGTNGVKNQGIMSESQTGYSNFADGMSKEDAARYIEGYEQ